MRVSMAPYTSHKLSEQLFNTHQEKRTSPRVPTNDLAQILFGKHVLGCLIHNISNEGAMIEISTSRVPERFILANFRTGKKMACEVMWRDHLRIGVRFITIPKSFHESFK